MKAIQVAEKIQCANTEQGRYDLVWEFIDEAHAEQWPKKKIVGHLRFLGFKQRDITKWFSQAGKWKLYPT